MMRVTAAIITGACLLVTSLSTTFAQEPAAPRQFAVPELSSIIERLSKSVGLIGQNRVEEAFEQLDTQSNPAFRNPQSFERFHDSWKKLFQPLGRLQLKFESFDVIGYRQVSSQAYFIYGTANGANGPAVFDFRVFRYRGKWHVHGFSFRAAGWDRDPAIPKDAKILPEPVRYPISDSKVATNDAGVANAQVSR